MNIRCAVLNDIFTEPCPSGSGGTLPLPGRSGLGGVGRFSRFPRGDGPMVEGIDHAAAEVIQPRSEDFRGYTVVGHDALQHEAAIRRDIREELAVAETIVVAEQSE